MTTYFFPGALRAPGQDPRRVSFSGHVRLGSPSAPSQSFFSRHTGLVAERPEFFLVDTFRQFWSSFQGTLL